jgi:hypothetical protein
MYKSLTVDEPLAANPRFLPSSSNSNQITFVQNIAAVVGEQSTGMFL